LTRANSPKVLHGSRMSSKMSEAVLSSTEGNDMAFCSFNTNGVPNSGGQFYDKTLVGDIEDLNAVCAWLKEHLPGLEKIFLLGFSTGAFLAVCAPVMASTLSEGLRSLLAGVVSVACLDDPRSGAKLDFSEEQIGAFNKTGECVAKFWPLVEVAIDERDGSVINSHEIDEAPKGLLRQLWLPARERRDLSPMATAYTSTSGKMLLECVVGHRAAVSRKGGSSNFFEKGNESFEDHHGG
ncbi:hypothetical protein FOZ63_030629, partial [Perkinsus olseni]